MVKNQVPYSIIVNIRKVLIDDAVSCESSLIKIKNDMGQNLSVMKKTVKDFSKSEYVPHRVANTVVTGMNQEDGISMSMALGIIHTAMFKIQEVMAIISVDIIPEMTELYGNAKSLFSTEKLKMMRSETLSRLSMTIKDKEREVDFVLIGASSKMSEIEYQYKSYRAYLNWMSSQLDYINRLDSMIRLKQKIDTSIFQESLKGGSIEL